MQNESGHPDILIRTQKKNCKMSPDTLTIELPYPDQPNIDSGLFSGEKCDSLSYFYWPQVSLLVMGHLGTLDHNGKSYLGFEL